MNFVVNTRICNIFVINHFIGLAGWVLEAILCGFEFYVKFVLEQSPDFKKGKQIFANLFSQK